MIIDKNGNLGIGAVVPTAKLHIATSDNPSITTQLSNFKNTSDYGKYAVSKSIGHSGNTLEFISRDYNNGGGVQNRDIISIGPECNIGTGKAPHANVKLDIVGVVAFKMVVLMLFIIIIYYLVLWE